MSSKTPSSSVVDIPDSGSIDSDKQLSGGSSLPLNPAAELSVPSQYSHPPYANSSMTNSVAYTQTLHENTPTAQKWYQSAKLLESSRTPVYPTDHPVQPQRALFNHGPPKTPVRKIESEGHVRVAGAAGGAAPSVVPQICTDATLSDRLWSKLEPPSHRDSMSSSSSISSSDTVIDLSLPNLARHTPSWPGCSHAPLVSCSSAHVTKSKSNPNIPQSATPHDALESRHLQPPPESPPCRLSQRRHTWSQLFMEGLKQSSGRPPATTSMFKSLGDLTSDDISCSFDSKYRSISRSFIIRPTHDTLRRGPLPTPNNLTMQLRRLTDVEPLSSKDIVPHVALESQEECVDDTLVRRPSSRSQSRVRYIANRAKKAQERQRLHGLARGSPIEERGNPEGACCVSQSPCSSLDLLSQLASLEPPCPRPRQSSDPDNSEVFFMLKL